MTRLLAAVPPGSYLAVTHSTSEVSGDRVVEAVRQWNQVAVTPYTLRSPEQIAAFFAGLQLSGDRPSAIVSRTHGPSYVPGGCPRRAHHVRNQFVSDDVRGAGRYGSCPDQPFRAGKRTCVSI